MIKNIYLHKATNAQIHGDIYRVMMANLLKDISEGRFMKSIMILGTSSHAGKTTLVSGLCRFYANQGLGVAPFKSQNMSLNSFATIHGEEIARSTAVQAFAARQQPTVHMNPILLKPKSDVESQVIIHGKVVADASAANYFGSAEWYSPKLKAIQHSISTLQNSYDLIIAEGAGSCAEPNFQSQDLVNMGIAKLLDADVYLVVDIDKGGAFADILGTLKILELTCPEELSRIKGVVLNKFRGDAALLQPAINFIEKNASIPILGVIPYLHNLELEEEDRVSMTSCYRPEVDIAIVYLPHIANTSDFNPLCKEDKVRVRFVRSPEAIGCPDLIILPGTKNTTWDLDYIRRIGWEEALRNLSTTTPVMGICGGLEMMGKVLYDPHGVESLLKEVPGLGFFDFIVNFYRQKKVAQVCYIPSPNTIFESVGKIQGYEIHCGQVEYGADGTSLFTSETGLDGIYTSSPLIFGTFVHDIFKNPCFTRTLVNHLRGRKNLPPLTSPVISPQDYFDSQCDQLAKILETHLHLTKQ